jgi:polyferredoxin
MRSLKYLLLGFFAWAIANMTPEAIERFMHSPYGAVADVRVLNFFRDLGQTAAIVLAVLVIASVLVQNFWCRYLCPYGATTRPYFPAEPVPYPSLRTRLYRLCEVHWLAPPPCPWTNWSPLSRPSVRGCLECVAVCPAEGALQLALGPWTRSPHHSRLPAWVMAAGIAVLFFGIIGYAKTAG